MRRLAAAASSRGGLGGLLLQAVEVHCATHRGCLQAAGGGSLQAEEKRKCGNLLQAAGQQGNFRASQVVGRIGDASTKISERDNGFETAVTDLNLARFARRATRRMCAASW